MRKSANETLRIKPVVDLDSPQGLNVKVEALELDGQNVRKRHKFKPLPQQLQQKNSLQQGNTFSASLFSAHAGQLYCIEQV